MLAAFPDARLGKLNLEELDELEDDEDEAILLEYRKKRLAEMKAEIEASKFGEVGGRNFSRMRSICPVGLICIVLTCIITHHN